MEIREVKEFGNSGHIILPKEWIGKKVKIEEAEPEKKETKKDV
jgi:hypothetical protein